MSNIEPMTPAQICDTKYGVAGFVNEYTIRQLLATIEQLQAQLAELKRHEQNCGDDRDYWFKRTKELKAQLDVVTKERDRMRSALQRINDGGPGVDSCGCEDHADPDCCNFVVSYCCTDCISGTALAVKPLVTQND